MAKTSDAALPILRNIQKDIAEVRKDVAALRSEVSGVSKRLDGFEGYITYEVGLTTKPVGHQAT